ncbi:MAG TPA: dTMP kinase [Pyrinomonadaceae bacterium]|nr:dTMP kinase [Pyrinomonadaceae bacterium]
MAGAFITFEGIDGCGKSTQLRLLASELRVRRLEVVTTREPGGTTLGQRLRGALLDTQEQVDPLAELLVFAADRAQHVRTLLRPALAANKIVLSDRYADATVAYQGSGRGFKPELIAEIVQLATEGLTPDLTLLFDLSVAESAVRTRKRFDAKHSDRLDSEDAAFHTRVRDAYVKMAEANPDRIRLIDARGSVQETHEVVKSIVMPFLKERGYELSAKGEEQSAKH